MNKISFALMVLLLIACRKDENITPEAPIITPPITSSFYLLNQGQWNSGKASLDYYDAKGTYQRNIYTTANPESVLGLGDVGNDMLVYGSKLYIAVNNSNKVEVLDANTGKRLKVIDVVQCRYLCASQGKVYVSAFGLEVNGFVAQIDTLSLTIEKSEQVGRQPEGLDIVGDKLYVANSGGYSGPLNYERTVSVIDLKSFKKINTIDVDINLHLVKADPYGDLYISSRGHWESIPPKLFVVDTKTNKIKQSFESAANSLCISDDIAYVISSKYISTSKSWENDYYMIDVKSDQKIAGSFISKEGSKLISTPYGIAIDPQSKKIYICDAKDFNTSGSLFVFNSKGDKELEIKTGNTPVQIAFKSK